MARLLQSQSQGTAAVPPDGANDTFPSAHTAFSGVLGPSGSARPRRLRVLFLANYFPKPGNVVMGTWALCQAQSLLRQGIDVQVVSPTAWVPKIFGITGGAKAYADCPHRFNWDGLKVTYPRWVYYPLKPMKTWAVEDPLPQLWLGWLSVARNLKAIVKRFNPDLIYAHHTLCNGYLALQLHRWSKLPFVLTDHDFEEITQCETYPRRKALFARIAREASTLICIASRMRDDVNRLFPEARTQVVFNGTDPLPATLWSMPRPAELNGKRVIFSAGAFYGRKGFPLLIQAFSKIAARYPNVVLRIAGDGEERGHVDAAVRESHVASRIQLLGFQPHAHIMQEMVWSDLFALVGWDEPWGVVFTEAMAAGKPIVWPSDGGINDVLRDGVHGYRAAHHNVDAAAEAMDRLLALSPAQRQAMGSAAKGLFERELTWDAHARNIKAIFTEAVAGRSTGTVGLTVPADNPVA